MCATAKLRDSSFLVFLIIENDDASIRSANKTIINRDLVTVNSLMEKIVSGIQGTKNFLVKKTAMKAGIAKTIVAL